MSEKKKGFLPFRNSSSVMHFYHNGTFNPHTIDESSPPKIKSYAASTERSTSYETIKKKRLQRQNKFKDIFDHSSQKSRDGSTHHQPIKGAALTKYIGYLQTLLLRLKSFQSYQEQQQTIQNNNKKNIQSTNIKKRLFHQDISSKPKDIFERSTSKKQIVNSLIDETKREKQIIKLNDIRNKYKHVSLYNPSHECVKRIVQTQRTPYEGLFDKNISNITKTKNQQSLSFASDISSEIQIKKRMDKPQQQRILDLMDMDSNELKMISKNKNLIKKQMNRWKNQFPQGFFDQI